MLAKYRRNRYLILPILILLLILLFIRNNINYQTDVLFESRKKLPNKHIAFFWHIPKSGGTTVDNFFQMNFFPGSPALAFLDMSFVDLLNKRLNGIGPSATENDFSSNYCSKNFKKNKYCLQRFSFDYQDMKDSLQYVHSPFLSETLGVLKKHNFRPVSAVLMRHPVQRFVSEYYYLQYAEHENSFDVKNQYDTIEEFIVKGKYHRNWMVCQLSNCPGSVANKKSLEVAKQNLVQIFEVVGFLDNIEKFVSDCKKAWNIDIITKKTVDRDNKGKKIKKPLSEFSEKLLFEAFKYDIELYDFARKTYFKNESENNETVG